ncbi:PD-(D/E)XK nuclease family protein [Streptomyces pinistramenti]|uniref:PD-(D/E)XK nuclease family protein n=1 Tax=Streptomyces pinistramenti TaxID=2884812 RepID=UPI001D08C0D8|nr:PD-(D/E)XK nuclease family protein [Streptomyces pinistramenti]MCB5909658.1 PD-(D/E)XK nuclease family protein [Streptomyces pinistramenti]
METWTPPSGLLRKTRTISVSVSMLDFTGQRCPASDSLKAMGLRPGTWRRRTPEALEHFTFGPFMSALDRSEHPPGDGRAAGLDGRRTHEGLDRWTEHAVATYRHAFPADPAAPMAEVEEPWVYRYQPDGRDHRGADEYRITLWGRFLSSPDGSVRELRVPAYRLGKPVSDVRRAVTAFVMAEGTPGPPPERVRVLRFALLDGRTEVLFNGTRDEAVALYREHGSKALTELLDRPEYRPGSACIGCSYLTTCPAVPKAPGLLGVRSEQPRPRRSWSATNGRSYRTCPARDHLRRLRLPAARELEAAPDAERGRAVHAYLAAQHSAHPVTPCTPHVPAHWVPERYELTDEQRRLGATLLRRHAAVCPLRHLRDDDTLLAEQRLVHHDTEADVLIIADPDLLYRDGESWVWREVKSSSRNKRWWRDPLRAYPQLALGVLLISHMELGGARSGARVELEVLRPGGADLEIIDPYTPAVRETADEVVRDHVRDWHQDDLFAPQPGEHCGTCEVSRWCAAASVGAAA